MTNYAHIDHGKHVGGFDPDVQTQVSTNTANIALIDEELGRVENRLDTLERREIRLYGMHIDGGESDPASMIVYLEDAVGMTPAYMDYSKGVFNYGSWGDAWFVKDTKPCVLNADGTVYCYLNKNDSTKDIDGNDVSDIIDGTNDFGQNVMIEFPKIWLKVIPSEGDDSSADVYFAPIKLDSDFKDYAYIDKNGNHKEHFYMPAYNGSLIDGVMRSLSDKQASNKLTAQQEIDACVANGAGWYTEDAGEVMLINFLLMLIGKSTDTQTVFGQGLHTSGTEAINNAFRTGVHNNKGLFFGTNSGTASDYNNAVKVFGIENWWGFQCRRYAGDINDNGTRKVKMCWGTEDGSTTNDFNLTGDGYVDVSATPSGTSGGYINKMKFTKKGMFSEVSSGSARTYYCDGQWFNNNQVNYAFHCGDSTAGTHTGAFGVVLSATMSRTRWYDSACPSFK